MSKKENGVGIGKFIAGAAVGAGLGLLFAPKSGSETRKELKEKGDKLVDDIKNINKEDIKKKIAELKEDLANLDKETAIEMVKEKASEIIDKADQLIKEAKEKSKPAIEKAAKEIKAKTAEILINAGEKLEDSTKDGKKNNKTKKA